jgi:alpha-tubulin suppressor-like RCC1 family protein
MSDHIIVLSVQGTVWICGELCPNVMTKPEQVQALPQVKFITQNTHFSAVLDILGQTWVWGSSEYVQFEPPQVDQSSDYTQVSFHSSQSDRRVGRPHVCQVPVKRSIDFTTITQPTLLNGWGHPRPAIISLSCGRVFSVALDEEGQVWMWGRLRFASSGYSRPSIIPGLPKVVQVACGDNHALALDNYGRAISWGLNDCGQLGLGSKTSKGVEVGPSIISHLLGRLVSCGRSFSLLVDHQGLVWMWGTNTRGQLGLNPIIMDVSLPTLLIPLPPVATASCGGFRCAAIDLLDRVWIWGSHSRQRSSYQLPRLTQGWPSPLPYFVQVSCRPDNYTLALDREGQVWMWNHEITPTLLDLPSDNLPYSLT